MTQQRRKIMAKTKTILMWGIVIIAAFVGFSEPTAEVLPYQLLAWAVLIGLAIRRKYADQC
jgi:hypothetical protein